MSNERVYQHRKMLLARLKAARSCIEALMIESIRGGHKSLALQDIDYIVSVVEDDISKEKEQA